MAATEECCLPEAEINAKTPTQPEVMLSRHVKGFADGLHITTEGGSGSVLSLLSSATFAGA